MKKLIQNVFLPITLMVTAIVIIGSGCSISYPPAEDEEPPQILIQKPSENAIFYTDGGVDSPDYLILEAHAVDDLNAIASGYVVIFNSENVEVFRDDATGGVDPSIYSTFRTLQPGEYKVEFRFKDALGNEQTRSKNVTCIYSAPDGSEG